MAILKPDMTLSLVNREFEALCGYPKEEIEGKKKCTEFIEPEVLDQFNPATRQEVESLTIPECQMVDRRGEIKHIHLSVEMIPDTSESIVSILDITDRKQAEEQIRKDLQEKEALLKEIHHRVKNNMQVLASLLKHQRRRVKEESYKQMLRENEQRIYSMSLAHEKVYRSDNMAAVDFGRFVKSVARSLFSSYMTDIQTVKLVTDAEDVKLPVDQAVPCGLIVNELVSNSLKYAFPEGRQGEVKVSLHEIGGNEVDLVISDNGAGLPEEIDFRKTDSLGLHLVTILAEGQLDGEVELDRSRGTEFRIKFKIAGTNSRF
ncbi:MAG: histidine kinase dimerization/phosphoacceptor domain -containing protein [Dehalococcoidia bacterium]